MADPINLRQVRKAKARAAAQDVAAQNRVTFGQTKAEKTKVRAQTALAKNRLDGALRDKASDT
jgi:Domain of unknown function (DUF4169)